MVPVATGLLIAHGAGAVIGPIVASLMFPIAHGRGLFVFVAFAGLLLALAALRWRLVKPAPAYAHHMRYVAIPEAETTPAVFDLDPRTEPQQLDFDFDR